MATPTQLSVSSELRLKLDDSNTYSLKPGQVLEVQVVAGPKGELGIRLNGTFVTASFPPGVGLGDKLTVQVQANSEQLLLKILSVLQDKSVLPKLAQAKFPWSDMLEKLLDNLPQELRAELKAALSQDKGVMPRQFSSTTRQIKNQGTTATPSTVSDQIIKQALDNLGSQKLLATSEEIGKGALLSKLLIKATEADLQTALVQAKTSIKQLEKFVSLSPAAKVLLFMQEQLTLLENSNKPLSFETSAFPESGRFKNMLEGVLSKILDLKSPEQLALLRSFKKIDGAQSDISVLLNFLQLFTSRSFVWKDTQAAGVLEQLFKSLLGGLREQREHKAGDAEIRALLSKSKQEVIGALAKLRISVESNGELHSLQSSLKSLESLLGAKEALHVLNPFFTAMGEPALYLIPAFADGFFSRWEMSINPFLITEERKKNSEEGDAYQVVELFIPLNSLGPLQVTLAHKSKEVLLKVICSSKNIADFLNQQFDQLEDNLKKLGYAHTSLKALQGEPREVSPHWYTEVLRSSIVA